MKKLELPKTNSKTKWFLIGGLLVIGFILSQLTPMFITVLLLALFGGLGFLAYKLWTDLSKKVNNVDEDDDHVN